MFCAHASRGPSALVAAVLLAVAATASAAPTAGIEADGYLRDYQRLNLKAVDPVYDDAAPDANVGDLLTFYADQEPDRLVFWVATYGLGGDPFMPEGASVYVLIDYADGGTMAVPGVDHRVPIMWDLAVALESGGRGSYLAKVYRPGSEGAERGLLRGSAVERETRSMELSVNLPEDFKAAVCEAAGAARSAYDEIAPAIAVGESTPLRYCVVSVVDGEVRDELQATNEPKRGDHNVAFVQHGNQGLTYTTVFWGVKGENASYAGATDNPDDGFDEILDAHDYYNVPGNFHMAGTLMTAAEWHDPAFNDSLVNGVNEGWANMVTSAYSQHIMPFVYDDMNSWSVYTERQMDNYRYGQWPTVAWVPERVWVESPDNDGNGINASCCVNDYIGDDFLGNGVNAVILDDYVHCGYMNGAFDDHHVYSYNGLKILPIDNDFVGQMNYDAGAAMNTIWNSTSDEIILYGNDWEVAAEVAGFDATHPNALENYIYVLQQCSLNSGSISVWKVDDIITSFPSYAMTLQNGTYGLLGEWYGYGGSCNQWYCDWAGYTGDANLDAHSPKWGYEGIWQNARNKIVTGPNNALSEAAWYVLMSMLHETGWHDSGQIADWENRYSNHMKNANPYSEAARWAEGWGSYGTNTTGAYLADFDEDGSDEAVIYNDRVMAIFESIGGKANWIFAKGSGYGYSVVGNDNVYWAGTSGDWNETNHVAALSDVSVGGLDREHDLYDMTVVQGTGSPVELKLTHGDGVVEKRVKLSLGDPYLDVIYDAGGEQVYVKNGWTPDLVDLIWDTEHYRVWDPGSGSYFGQRNTSSAATAAIVVGQGGASHNLTQTATLLEVDEFIGTGQFEFYLYAGATSAPVSDEIAELEALSATLTDTLKPRPIAAQYYPSADRLDITFNEMVQYDNVDLTGVGIDEDNDGTPEVTLTAGATVLNAEDASLIRVHVAAATAALIEALTPGTLELNMNVDSFFDISMNGNRAVGSADNVKVIYGADTKITIDGYFDPAEWAPYTLVVDDPDDDSTWHPADPLLNELYGLYVDWDADFLYIGVNGQVESNSWLLYLDADPGGPNGQTDLTAIDTWERGATFTASGFRADFEYGCYQHQGVYDSDGFFSIDSPTTATALTDSLISDFDSFHTYGVDGGSEMAIPWHVLYGLGPGQVPPNAELSLVCSICWDPEPDGQLGGDSAPSKISAALPVVDNAYTIIVDHDGDGLPDEGATDVPEGGVAVIGGTRLMQNRPNPFNPATTVGYVVAGGVTNVTLAVYDVAGRRVATLVDGPVEPGEHLAAWDGTDSYGRPVASGVYFARLETGETRDVAKMILLK